MLAWWLKLTFLLTFLQLQQKCRGIFNDGILPEPLFYVSAERQHLQLPCSDWLGTLTERDQGVQPTTLTTCAKLWALLGEIPTYHPEHTMGERETRWDLTESKHRSDVERKMRKIYKRESKTRDRPQRDTRDWNLDDESVPSPGDALLYK